MTNVDVTALAGDKRDGGLWTQGEEAWRVVRPSKPLKRSSEDTCERAKEGGKGIDQHIIIEVVLNQEMGVVQEVGGWQRAQSGQGQVGVAENILVGVKG